MAEYRITILDEEDGQTGLHIWEMLHQESGYQVDLIRRPLTEVAKVWGNVPHLVIPVLPRSECDAEKLLACLRAVENGSLLLPVVRAEALGKIPNDLLLWPKDFLVTPLREGEVRARVRRMMPDDGGPAGTDIRERAVDTRGLAQLVGEDPAFVAIRRKIPVVARAETAVLLTGETGTGKERCARALHHTSRRAAKPFLPVNCGAIPTELFENELYGHQKGAYTGAVASEQGLIAEANGGTLLLDEIEALDLASQVKLLRFLQDQTYYALGCAKRRQADVWIIGSTNVDLMQKVRERSFREDLFYRLAVVTLCLPPLRERRADIPVLANHFLKLYGERHGKQMQMSRQGMDALCCHSWPGNVRELENVIQQLIVLGESRIIEPENLPIRHQLPLLNNGSASLRQTKATVIEQFERTYVKELLRAYQGNVTHAAQAARMERRTLGRLIKKYHIAKH